MGFARSHTRIDRVTPQRIPDFLAARREGEEEGLVVDGRGGAVVSHAQHPSGALQAGCRTGAMSTAAAMPPAPGAAMVVSCNGEEAGIGGGA